MEPQPPCATKTCGTKLPMVLGSREEKRERDWRKSTHQFDACSFFMLFLVFEFLISNFTTDFPFLIPSYYFISFPAKKGWNEQG
jgi:hypothetical protein